MCTALKVANRLLEIADCNGDLITNLKLQKLLYYAQAFYLVNNKGEKLFDDEIQAWEYGPVVPAVYHEYKKYNSFPINYKHVKDKIFNFSKKQEQYLKDFASEYFRYSATELVTKTHTEQPWKTAISKGKNTVIDTNEMYSFYTDQLKNEQ